MNTDAVLALATIIRHRDAVRLNVQRLTQEMERRALAHDMSKLSTDEVLGFVRINRAVREHPYDSPEYRASMDAEREPGGCIDLHFSRNSHHPEFHAEDFEMGWLDLVEMVLDWKAAADTYGQSTLREGLERQRGRLAFTPEQWWLVEEVVEWLEPTPELAVENGEPDEEGPPIDEWAARQPGGVNPESAAAPTPPTKLERVRAVLFGAPAPIPAKEALEAFERLTADDWYRHYDGPEERQEDVRRVRGALTGSIEGPETLFTETDVEAMDEAVSLADEQARPVTVGRSLGHRLSEVRDRIVRARLQATPTPGAPETEDYRQGWRDALSQDLAAEEATCGLDWLPPHKCALHLEHNPHLSYYQTVEQWDEHAHDEDDWVSPEERERAIATGEVWSLQWYPDTPVGFLLVLASSLDGLRRAFPSADPSFPRPPQEEDQHGTGE